MNQFTFEEMIKAASAALSTGGELMKLSDASIPYKVGLEEIDDTWRSHADLLLDDENRIVAPHPLMRLLDTIKGFDGSDHGWLFFVMGGLIAAHHFIKNGKVEVVEVVTGVESDIVGAVFQKQRMARFGYKMYALNPVLRQFDKEDLDYANRLSSNYNPDIPLGSKQAAAILGKMFAFLFMVNHPAHNTVLVKPPATKCANRSVEWVKGRSHYMIVDSSDNQRVRQGHAPIGVTTRAVHWRRKHWRTLRSDRFTKKQGQRILIRRSWVGPTEWLDSQRNQYQLVR